MDLMEEDGDNYYEGRGERREARGKRQEQEAGLRRASNKTSKPTQEHGAKFKSSHADVRATGEKHRLFTLS